MNMLGVQVTFTKSTTRLRWTRRAAVLATATAVTIGGGVAYAYWTTTGSGSGTSQARTFTALTVNAGAAPAGQLYPGLTADGSTAGGDLVLSVTNTNPFPVQITAVAPGTGTISVTGGLDATTCSTSTGVSLISKSGPNVVYESGTNVPAGATNFKVTVSKVVSMSTASDSGCQGATFTLPNTGVTLTYTSS